MLVLTLFVVSVDLSCVCASPLVSDTCQICVHLSFLPVRCFVFLCLVFRWAVCLRFVVAFSLMLLCCHHSLYYCGFRGLRLLLRSLHSQHQRRRLHQGTGSFPPGEMEVHVQFVVFRLLRLRQQDLTRGAWTYLLRTSQRPNHPRFRSSSFKETTRIEWMDGWMDVWILYFPSASKDILHWLFTLRLAVLGS